MKRMTLERLMRGMNQTQLARNSFLSNRTINSYETGKRLPTRNSIQQVADALGWTGNPTKLLEDLKRGDTV